MRKLISRLKNKWFGKGDKAGALTGHLVKGMAWNVSGTVLSKVFVIGASILVARILGVDKNGEYGVINSTVVMFSTIAGLGLGTTATRFTAEYRVTDKPRCGRVIGMTMLFGAISGMVMAIVLFALAPWIARDILNKASLVTGLRLASFLLFINTLTAIQTGTLSGFEAFKSIAKVSVIQGLLSFPVFVAMTLWLSVEGLIIGYIIISIFAFVMFEIANRKKRREEGIHVDIRGIKSELGILWRFSLPSMLSGIVVSPVMWLGNTIMTAMANGYSQLGIFNAAYQWRTAITFIPTAIGSVILPAIVINRDDVWLDRVNILLSWIIVNIIAIPLLAGPELIGWLYGGNYAGQAFNVTFLFIIMMCCFLSYKEGIARNLISKQLMWWGLLDNLLWGAIFIGSILFLRVYGTIGMAVSYFVAYLLTTIVFIPFYIHKRVVSRSLLFSRWILLMWLALALQLAAAILTKNVWIRIACGLFSGFALYHVIKLILRKEPAALDAGAADIPKTE